MLQLDYLYSFWLYQCNKQIKQANKFPLPSRDTMFDEWNKYLIQIPFLRFVKMQVDLLFRQAVCKN